MMIVIILNSNIFNRKMNIFNEFEFSERNERINNIAQNKLVDDKPCYCMLCCVSCCSSYTQGN